jgi:hypothetical protein
MLSFGASTIYPKSPTSDEMMKDDQHVPNSSGKSRDIDPENPIHNKIMVLGFEPIRSAGGQNETPTCRPRSGVAPS